MRLSDETKQEILSARDEASNQLNIVISKLKELDSQYEDLLYQKRGAERQLWLAKIALGEDGEATQNRQPGRFLSKTIPVAAGMIIEEAGRMLSSREIADVLIYDGRVFANMTNATASITTSLKRHPDKFFRKSISGVNRFGLVRGKLQEKE